MSYSDVASCQFGSTVLSAIDAFGKRQWFAYSEGIWISVVHLKSTTPQQGWKLHVSAYATSAVDVLNRCLPVLLADTAQFKVAGSLPELERLNGGFHRRSQIGKFITVYPVNDAQAVELALALDAAT